jgi:mannosyltransferase OCH1-like enzyme
MSTDYSLEKNQLAQSNFILQMVQCSTGLEVAPRQFARKVPKRIVQFWDEVKHLPGDVMECINTWRSVEEQGFERLLFDRYQARDFISEKLGKEYLDAYEKCSHPAMQSDYFRLCYIAVEGGCYIDTDDVYNGIEIQHFFNDGRLKVQPLCYDIGSNRMVAPPVFAKPGASNLGWIVYFNNNPLIACSGHPIIERALTQATRSLKQNVLLGTPEIQSIAGPGNLTKVIFEEASLADAIVVLSNWEDVATCKWELGYRNDVRNWRNVFWK